MSIIGKILKGIITFYTIMFAVGFIANIIDSKKEEEYYSTSYYDNNYTTNDYDNTSYTDNTYTDNTYTDNYYVDNSYSASTYSDSSYSCYTNSNYLETVEQFFYGAKIGNGDLILQCFPDVTWQILEYYGYDSGYFAMEPEENIAYTVTDTVHLTTNYDTYVNSELLSFMGPNVIHDMYAVTVKVYPDASFPLDYSYGTIYVGLIQGSWRIVNVL